MGLKDTIKRHVGGMIWYGVGKNLTDIENKSSELLWARIWDDTCRNIEWISDLGGISPGRWAVGYNYIYVMTRILNELNPHSILDLGLGISSSLISSYVNYYSRINHEDVYNHIVVEQDPKWIEVYKNTHTLGEKTHILERECISIDYNASQTYKYKDFESVVKDKKFDVISIDGPYGGERYSRRDIVPYLPDVLTESFVIIMDDTDRDGELDTVNEIIRVLEQNGVAYAIGSYDGLTKCTVITSINNKYLCTM